MPAEDIVQLLNRVKIKLDATDDAVIYKLLLKIVTYN